MTSLRDPEPVSSLSLSLLICTMERVLISQACVTKG